MLKKLPLFIVVIFISSCATHQIALKGNYNYPPYVVESEKSYEEVWTTLIDTIAVWGYGIDVLDMQSGIIIFNDVSFNGTFSRETDEGKLVNEQKFIAVSRWIVLGEQVKPNRITATWNIRVKPNNVTGKIRININLNSIEAYYKDNKGEIYDFEAKSTQKFEKRIGEIFI